APLRAPGRGRLLPELVAQFDLCFVVARALENAAGLHLRAAAVGILFPMRRDQFPAGLAQIVEFILHGAAFEDLCDVLPALCHGETLLNPLLLSRVRRVSAPS